MIIEIQKKFSIKWYYDKIQNKKRMRYLNKQNSCLIYMNVRRQNKKYENDELMDRVVQSPYWRESLHIAALITSMRNLNPYSCILTNSLCIVATLKYQSVVLMMLLCVNLLKSPTLTWMKRYLPTTLGNWKVHRSMILLMISQKTFWNHDFPWALSGCLLEV